MVARSREIDITEFQPLLLEALRAYTVDVSYAASMARQAVTVKHKRMVWAARLELRRAEKDAQDDCVASSARACGITSPCGTGRCPFAQGEFASLDVPPDPGKSTRPLPSQVSSYTIESAVKPLLAARSGKETAYTV